MPLQIYLTESGLTLEQLGENVIDQLEADGRCIVVVSEGFDVGDVARSATPSATSSSARARRPSPRPWSTT